MTEQNEMPEVIWAFNNCYPDDPGTYSLNGTWGGEHYTKTSTIVAGIDREEAIDDVKHAREWLGRGAKPRQDVCERLVDYTEHLMELMDKGE